MRLVNLQMPQNTPDFSRPNPAELLGLLSLVDNLPAAAT